MYFRGIFLFTFFFFWYFIYSCSIGSISYLPFYFYFSPSWRCLSWYEYRDDVNFFQVLLAVDFFDNINCLVNLLLSIAFFS